MSKKQMSVEEFIEHIEVNRYLWGEDNDLACYYKHWLLKYEMDLLKAESWLRTNPNNEFTQAEVTRLRKRVQEFRRSYDMCRTKRILSKEEQQHVDKLELETKMMKEKYESQLRKEEDACKTSRKSINVPTESNKNESLNDLGAWFIIICAVFVVTIVVSHM